MSGPAIPPFQPGREEQFAPGVKGFRYEYDGVTYYPVVVSERPGHGDVGRWLDSLEGARGFVEVMDEILAGALLRRGYVRTVLPVGIGGEMVEVMYHGGRE